MSLSFYSRYAWRALLRDGQRTVLAVLCIAFGVMSLVAMQLLSGVIRDAVVSDPRASLGGDIMLAMSRKDALTPEELAQIEGWKSDGTLSQYTLVSSPGARWLKPAGTGEVYMLTGGAIGVDPATFPLVGQVHLANTSLSFADAIKQAMNAVITSDISRQLDLKVGDSFTLMGGDTGVPRSLRVSAIADSVPGERGSSVFFSRQTADRIGGRAGSVNYALANWGLRGEDTKKIGDSGWIFITWEEQQQNNAQTADLFSFMLKGAGILGLFVGGIGVANTLQVVLARRMLEIATLKTLGYSRRDLLALFGIETALLGLIGGIVGMVVALGLSFFLSSLFANTGAILLHWQADPLILVGGVLMGMVTAVIFGLYTIVRASSVRPAVLLRELPAKLGWGARLAGFGLLLVLLVLVTGLSIAIMGKLVDGVAVVGGALVGAIVLTLIFGGTLLTVLSAPTPGLPLVSMARRNLKRRPMRSVFALIALFMGILSIGLAASVILNARNRLAARQLPLDGPNLTVYGRLSDADSTAAQLSAQGVISTHLSVHVPAAIQANGKSVPQVSYVDGRRASDATWDLTVVNGKWTGAANDAIVPMQLSKPPLSLKVGDSLSVKTPSGPEETLVVSGFYDMPRAFGAGDALGGVIVPQDTATRLGGTDTSLVYTGHAPQDRVSEVTSALGRALPQTSVISQTQINQAANRVFNGLFTFAVGLAGLALVAGTILIANAVGLAMVERRREMGILKAVGFTAGRVLGTLLIENAMLGFLGGVLGMVGVAVAIWWINNAQPGADLSLSPPLVLLMIGISIALAMVSAALVAWRPTHVRPLEVLRNE